MLQKGPDLEITEESRAQQWVVGGLRYGGVLILSE